MWKKPTTLMPNWRITTMMKMKKIIIVVMMITTSSFCEASDTFRLNIIKNVKVTAGIDTTTKQTRSMLECVTLCVRNSQCRSMSFNSATGLCHINKVALTSTWAVVLYDESYKYGEVGKRVAWKLGLRATQGIDQSVLNTWNNVGHYDDMTTVSSNTVGCVSVDGRLPCDKQFRTPYLDDWSNVALVRHEFFTDSNSMFFVTFDASGIDAGNRDDHFRASRIVDSSVDELKGYSGAVNVQSILGTPHCVRRFHLSKYYSYCNTDCGWMVINDGTNPCCGYDQFSSYPAFGYTRTEYAAPYESGFDYAQVYAVFLMYED